MTILPTLSIMEYTEITDSQLFWLVIIIYAMIPVFLFGLPLLVSLLEVLFSSKKRWCFISDMQEYEYRLSNGYPLPDYLRDRDFRILMWLYHKLYDKKDKKENQE